jgi:hypothetical protein
VAMLYPSPNERVFGRPLGVGLGSSGLAGVLADAGQHVPAVIPGLPGHALLMRRQYRSRPCAERVQSELGLRSGRCGSW